MVQLLDFASVEVSQNTQSLPLVLAPGTETMLTGIFLNMASASAQIVIEATIGWEPQLLLPVLPKLTVRLRRGGFTVAFPEVYQTTDSAIIGTTPLLTNTKTTSMVHYETPAAGTVGTYQPYYLTVQSQGLDTIIITGPVTLVGQVIG